jgi:hypothetical protein
MLSAYSTQSQTKRITRPSNIVRCAHRTAFSSLVLRMAAPLLRKTINKKAAVVGGVKWLCMNRTITFVFFVVISSFCLSSSINMSIGDSEDKLYEIEGDATQVTELTIKDKTFVTYFYQATNTSFIVDKELKTICKISQGKVNGTCP